MSDDHRRWQNLVQSISGRVEDALPDGNRRSPGADPLARFGTAGAAVPNWWARTPNMRFHARVRARAARVARKSQALRKSGRYRFVPRPLTAAGSAPFKVTPSGALKSHVGGRIQMKKWTRWQTGRCRGRSLCRNRIHLAQWNNNIHDADDVFGLLMVKSPQCGALRCRVSFRWNGRRHFRCAALRIAADGTFTNYSMSTWVSDLRCRWCRRRLDGSGGHEMRHATGGSSTAPPFTHTIYNNCIAWLR